MSLADGPLVSVVVPVLNEERALPVLLDHLADLPGRWEILVADGGSSDASVEIARRHPLGARVLQGERGRALQMNAAAEEASGDLLLFLHADTRLPAGAYESLATVSPAAVGGNFTLRFDGDDRFSRFLGAVYATQRRLGVYYGDSTLFVRRDVFRELGGFRPLPIMEDYDFARRLEGSGRTVCLPGPAVTSGRRWRELGAARTLVRWLVIQGLYLAGVAPERLARLYRDAR